MHFKILTLSFLFIANSAFSQQWIGDNTSEATIYRGGRVGISTKTPLNKLHVDGAIRITGQSTGYGGPALVFGKHQTSNYGNYVIEYLPDEGLNFSIPWPNPGFGNYDLILSTTNKIGMGTNVFNCSDCDEYRLFVKDGIRTEKIKVDIANQNGWADYVFEDNYNLISLNKLSEYIKKERHLPNIPTSLEVVETGVELKELNVKLLEKIEELTLYIIDLNRDIKSNQDQIIELEKKIKEFNNQL